MATPGEKKAPLFLSLVAVLGSVVRLVSAYQVPIPSPDEVSALEAQIRVVDSARRSMGTERRSGGGKVRVKRGRDRLRATDSATSAPPVRPPAAPSLVRQPFPLDLNSASAAQLESLPGIGPALAGRIASARDSAGPFESLQDLQLRVRGIGPALARRLAPDVTFSGARSPPSAERTQPFGNGETTARRSRRRGR